MNKITLDSPDEIWVMNCNHGRFASTMEFNSIDQVAEQLIKMLKDNKENIKKIHKSIFFWHKKQIPYIVEIWKQGTVVSYFDVLDNCSAKYKKYLLAALQN